MAYVQQSWRDRPGAVTAVVAIHAVIGYALVTGLGYSKIIEVVKNPGAIFIPDVPLPPPPPEPVPQPTQKAIDPPMVAPLPKFDVGPQRPPVETTPNIVPSPDVRPYIAPLPTPTPAPRPAFDAVGASPRGNPASWVTVDDYRTNWINRELTGVARFRLDVGANGRVSNCTITASSGHPELDKATCALVTTRARFAPAKDGSGAAVSGSYANAVRWELPE